jgi:hypothetical protein
MNIPESLYHGIVHSAVRNMIDEKMIVPKRTVYGIKKDNCDCHCGVIGDEVITMSKCYEIMLNGL